MSRMGGLTLCLILAGCGKGQLFGPAPDAAVKVTITNHTTLVLPVAKIEEYIKWRDTQVSGLKGKHIQIDCYWQTGKILGVSDTQFNTILLYVSSTGTTRTLLLTVAQEVDRLRGLDESSLKQHNYEQILKEFGL